MTKDEALKKAFKQAFQLGQDYWYQADHEYVSQNKKSDVTRAKFEQLMEDAIKEALAQPEQEPVACVEYIPCCTDQTCQKCKAAIKPELVCVCGAVWEGQELIYTTPQRTWVGLTDEEIDDIYQGVGRNDLMLVREVEAKLREKNATAQPVVPDAIGPNEDELPAYAAGWNDCRAEMLRGRGK